MFRVSLCAFACLWLAGCVTNTLSTQNAQLAAGGMPVVARAPAPPPVRVVTPTARLANARMITVNKTTTSGATLILASPQALNRDCSPLGQVDVKVMTPPEHGAIHIENGMAFSTYSPGDPPYICNARRTPATLVTYRSVQAFPDRIPRR